MNVDRPGIDQVPRLRRRGELIANGPSMVGDLEVGIIDAVELPEHLERAGLAAGQVAREDSGERPECPPAQMLAIEPLLRADELLIKLRQRQASRQDRMLNVEQPVVARGEQAR